MRKYSLTKILIGVFAVILITMQSTYAQQQHHPVQPNTQMAAPNPQMQGGMQMPMAQTPQQSGMMQQGMMQGMMMQNPNLPYDQRALNMMIMHQQMRINIAQNILQNTQCPELKKMAQKIIDENTCQIQQMQTYRKQYYGQ